MHHQLQPPASLLHPEDDYTSQTVGYTRPVFTSLTPRPRRCQPVRHSFSQWMTWEVCRGLRLIILRWWVNQMMTRSRHHLRQCHTTTWSVRQSTDCRVRCHAHISHLNSLWLC